MAFIRRLRAAGFPSEVIRSIVTAQVYARFDVRIRELRSPDATVPFWKIKEGFFGPQHQRAQESWELQRERASVTRHLFADEFFASDEVTTEQRRQFGNLTRSKVDLVSRIEDDYRQMNAAVNAATGGITLPEDRAQLDLLAREKLADLAAVLTPDELTDYRLRTSPITDLLRDRSGGFEATEAEFRALYAAQENLNARFGPNSPSTVDQVTRRRIHDQYLADLHGGLGQARFLEYLRESNDEYQQMVRIAERSNLPRDVPLQLYGLRERIAAESNRIYDDGTLGVEQKREALKLLASASRDQILLLLGPVAGPSYLKVADRWLPHVESGAAVSFARAQTITVATERNRHSFGASPDFRFLPRR